ncbi:MAG: exodeoxyribonuclease VII large subunit [Halothiobacillaceae bacterium]|nr:MAG: exodeoxyribonuclease VII large subunit [Halothiobacillaceae bacterium]
MLAHPIAAPLSVSALLRGVKDMIEQGFPLVTVEGELSNLARPGSGHLYFTLKDSGGQIRCAMFRNRASLIRFRPQDGAKVMARARITVYEPRGDLQLVIEHMEEAGLGALQRAFEMLKQRLVAEGLFDADRKKPLPALPSRIGVITSPTGAAVRDVMHVLERRFPLIPVRIYPTSVQGAAAVDEIVSALQRANARADCDVLLLVRGGGSLEDLWSFNDERVARAVAASELPIICGVGHETDFTIADFVADARAPTPSAAASMAAPDAQALEEHLTHTLQRLSRRARHDLERRFQLLDGTARHLQALHPHQRLLRMRERLDGMTLHLAHSQRHALREAERRLVDLSGRLVHQHPGPSIRLHEARLESLSEAIRRGMERTMSAYRERLRQRAGQLHVLSPLATLERGYAIIEDAEGNIVTRVSQIKEGDAVRTRLQDGVLNCEVRSIEKGAMPAG